MFTPHISMMDSSGFCNCKINSSPSHRDDGDVDDNSDRRSTGGPRGVRSSRRSRVCTRWIFHSNCVLHERYLNGGLRIFFFFVLRLNFFFIFRQKFVVHVFTIKETLRVSDRHMQYIFSIICDGRCGQKFYEFLKVSLDLMIRRSFCTLQPLYTF